MSGFNLHAGVSVAGDDRDALERLCGYMARSAGASGRVTRLPDGNVAYRVKSPRGGDASGDDADGIHGSFERAGIVRILEHLGVSTGVLRMRRARDGP